MSEHRYLRPGFLVGFRDENGKYAVVAIGEGESALQSWGVIRDDGFPLDWHQILTPF